MKIKILVCLALVCGFGLAGCSTGARPVPGTAADRYAAAEEYFRGYLAGCKTNEIRCLWFLDDNPVVGMEMTINLQDSTVLAERDVYDWALQGSESHKLEYFQVFTLKQIVEKLPPSDQREKFGRLVFISRRSQGRTELFQYARRHVPAAVQRIYDISGGYFYSGNDHQP